MNVYDLKLAIFFLPIIDLLFYVSPIVGYKMLINKDEDKVRRLTLRYCFYLLPLGPAAYAFGLTTWMFPIGGTLLTLWMAYQSLPFYKYTTTERIRSLKTDTKQNKLLRRCPQSVHVHFVLPSCADVATTC